MAPAAAQRAPQDAGKGVPVDIRDVSHHFDLGAGTLHVLAGISLIFSGWSYIAIARSPRTRADRRDVSCHMEMRHVEA